MEKIFRQEGKAWVECSSTPVDEKQTTKSGTTRICAMVTKDTQAVFKELSLSMEEPYFLVYVLHTTRGEGDCGRYQSPELSKAEFVQFLHKFREYFWSDARFDIWAYSPGEKSTIVWDRHNMLYAYGPIPRFESVLANLGYEAGRPMIPAPHEHHYRKEFDAAACSVLNYFDWIYIPS